MIVINNSLKKHSNRDLNPLPSLFAFLRDKLGEFINCGEREGKGAGGAERETLTHSSACPLGAQGRAGWG